MNTKTSNTTSNTTRYDGYNDLITYLNEQVNPSYRGFLMLNNDTIINSLSSNNWKHLDNTWSARFLTEAKSF
ncbi:hypothetical protein RclHR1_02600013 [Rhizophagus clarus]|uniref:Uncharacterized protein n=1 Tax=Rhizophagus clarus TaxID=94130 RepID=A0A2Z6RCR0_9GLOM|nr:hypothetical protein RclHR1_02600013 [Rhizophagus clarus]